MTRKSVRMSDDLFAFALYIYIITGVKMHYSIVSLSVVDFSLERRATFSPVDVSLFLPPDPNSINATDNRVPVIKANNPPTVIAH